VILDFLIQFTLIIEASAKLIYGRKACIHKHTSWVRATETADMTALQVARIILQ